MNFCLVFFSSTPSLILKSCRRYRWVYYCIYNRYCCAYIRLRRCQQQIHNKLKLDSNSILLSLTVTRISRPYIVYLGDMTAVHIVSRLCVSPLFFTLQQLVFCVLYCFAILGITRYMKLNACAEQK